MANSTSKFILIAITFFSLQCTTSEKIKEDRYNSCIADAEIQKLSKVEAVEGCLPKVWPDVENSTVDGALFQKEVVAGLKPLLPKMRSCYSKALERNSELQGVLQYRWVVNSSGKATELLWEEASSTITFKPLQKCMFDLLSKAKYEKP